MHALVCSPTGKVDTTLSLPLRQLGSHHISHMVPPVAGALQECQSPPNSQMMSAVQLLVRQCPFRPAGYPHNVRVEFRLRRPKLQSRFQLSRPTGSRACSKGARVAPFGTLEFPTSRGTLPGTMRNFRPICIQLLIGTGSNLISSRPAYKPQPEETIRIYQLHELYYMLPDDQPNCREQGKVG